MLNLTTIQYLNLPVRNSRHSIFDSDDDDDDDDDFYYSDSEDSDINQTTVRKRSLRVHPQWFGYPLYRKVTLKTRRTWILVMRVFVPNYKYRRLNAAKNDGCIPSGGRQLLPTSLRRKDTKRDDRFRTRDNVNMEEFLATKTIRPVMTADGEEIDEPDYDDDMGLDFTSLDLYDNEDGLNTKKVETKQRVSKAARLLDLPEEEALIQIQQQQHLGNIEIKEESALYEL
ncbi:hypothetical protein BDF21DRAFT_58315 [Thamnidium elegans]|uniref:Uncharacterized protein n=1 Tax=Thamnidium elegans TaxID=101142 RepID=A0A8H7ST70_9FUNG|nr:hypothetical protein INT48_006205 [Thamnidium elegans]KAI8077151.1 hypothetical protein BDF21DRAFT_58315 [Thamnidium elegans]